MAKNILLKKEIDFFQDKGFLIKRSFLKNKEIEKIINTIKKDPNFKFLFNKGDQINKDKYLSKNEVNVKRYGMERKILLWNDPGNDILGITSRLEKVVGAMEQLLLDEIYHYHSKITDVPVGRSGWSWHQDYGYWYQNGCLFPDMGSLFIPLENCLIENGCLQIISESHKLGRIDHVKPEENDLTIHQERLKYILNNMEKVDCELNVGDVLFFHSNLLHSSNNNTTGKSRLALLCCYNTKHNNPVKKHHHPRYKPIIKMPNNSIMNFNKNIIKKESDFLKNQKYPTLK